MSSPLSFSVIINPLTPQIDHDVLNCGDSFDVKLKITVRGNSTFSHKGVFFEFSTDYVPEKGKTISLTNPVQMQICESGTISGMVEIQQPQLTIPSTIQTYHGALFSIKHMLKFVVKKSFGSIEHQHEVVAYVYGPCVSKLQPLCVRVAVADNLRFDLAINRRKFELRDVILGGAHFLLVAIKIVRFEVALVAQEVTEVSGKALKNSNTIFSWEISDGAPVKGEIIPFRLYLAPLNLSPSVADSSKGYSVSHFLEFKIHSSSGQKYFKSLEIKLGKWTSMPFEFSEEK